MKEPFNIKIGYGENEVTLTILPVEENYYKVIYFGGVMGAVCFNGEDWDLIEKEDVEAGDLPLYEPELKGDRLEIVLDQLTVDAIGEEIELYSMDDD
jgi:hypothetical protein